MTRIATLLAVAALAAGCQATATGAITPGGASASPVAATGSAAPSAKPSTTASAAPSAMPSAASTNAAASQEAASVTLKVDGADVPVAKGFQFGTTSKGMDWDFNKPERGYTAAGVWWITVGLIGTATDVKSVTLSFRRGTGAGAERSYTLPPLTASQYTVAGGKLDVDFQGQAELIGSGGDAPAKVAIDFVLKGAALQ